MDQTMYTKNLVTKYLDSITIKENPKWNKTTLTHDIVLAKKYASTIYEQVEKLSRDYKIQYIACVGLLIYLSSTGVDFCLAAHKFLKVLSNPG